MADRIELAELNISFVGGTDDLQKGVQQAKAVVTASFNKISDSGDKVERSTKNVDESFKKLDTSAVNLAARINLMEKAYSQFTQVARQGLALAQLGAQSERVEDRFRKFGATIGSSDELLAAFNKGSAGAVDQMTAMNSAALLVQQGLVTNNAEMEKTVEMATRLGDQTLGATHRLEFFSQLLKNQSIRLLDNFGISSGRVRTRILELQEATAGLSREEAFRIATFEEGQKALDVLGEQVEDNALQFERATAKMQDMRVEMGQMLVPAGAKAMEMFASLNNITIILITTLTGALGIMIKFSGGLDKMLTKLKMSGRQFGVLALAIGTAIAAYEVIKDLQDQVAEGQEAAAEATQKWTDEVKVAVEEGGNLGDSIEDLARRVNIADEALHADGNIIMDLATAYARTTSESKIMGEAADEVRAVIIQQADSLEHANQMIEIYNSRVDNAEALLDDFTEAQWRNIEASDTWGSSVNAINAAFKFLGAELPDLNQLIVENTEREEAAAKATEEHAESIGSLGRMLEMAALRQKRMNDAQRKTYETGQLLIEMEQERMDKREKRAEAAAKLVEDAIRDAEKEAAAIVRAQEKVERAREKARRAFKRAQKERQRAFKASQREAEAEAAAIRRIIELQEQALNVQVRRAEQFKDATAQQVAGVAISDLEKAQRAGLISFDEYAQAVVEIQDRFGLADDSSRALTLGLATLVDQFIDGNVAASEFDDILESLIKNAGILADQFDDVNIQANKLVERSMKLSGDVDDTVTSRGLDGLAGISRLDPRSREIQSARGQDSSQAAQRGSGVTIYGDIKLEGVEDAEDFLRQLMSLME